MATSPSLRTYLKRIVNSSLSLALVIGSISASLPFILPQPVSALTTVNSQAELVAAIADTSEAEIVLGSDIEVTSQITISRSLILNGNNKVLSANFTKTSNSNNAALGIVSANNVTVNNLIVDGVSSNKLHGINAYNSSSIVLDGVTVRNFNTWVGFFNPSYGIVVNGSSLTANNLSTTNNMGAGVNVDNGSTFTVTGQSQHAGGLLGAIYREGGVVNDTNEQYNHVGGLYYLKAAPVAPSFTTPTPSEGEVITASSDVTLAWSKPSYATTFEYTFDGGATIVSTGTSQGFTDTLANGAYALQVRSVAASGLTGNWSAPRTFTVSVYNYSENDSRFVSSPKYVQANGAHASHNISAEVHVPALSDEVRFFVSGSGPIVGTHINAVNANTDRWRLITPLAPGEHEVTAEYHVNSAWYHVTGSGLAYSIDAPTAEYVLPNNTNNVFRPSDNPLRLKVEDQYEQFRRMVVTIKQGSVTVGAYEVVRADCDDRQAGNYLFCDVDASATWTGLVDGDYTASTTTYTKANNRVDNLVSREFTIDSEKPAIVSLTSPATVSSILGASAIATDNTAVDSVNFYVTEPRHDGVCTGNGPKLAELRVSSLTSGAYNANLAVSSLNGTYCVSAVARDTASSNSAIVSNIVTIDNTAPVVAVDTLPATTDTTPLITGTVDDPAADIEVTIDGTVYIAINNRDGTWEYQVTTPLTVGTHSIVASASDTVGNNSASAPATLTINSVPFTPAVLPASAPANDTPSNFGILADSTVADTTDEDVLGEQTPADNEGDEEVLATTNDNQDEDEDDTASLFGLAWYWWLAILAALAALWWLIAAYLRRRGEQEA